ncbi:MAG: hypothetical protein JNL76_05560 [Alphaproteobacteria bacterium]|nr:hypothetical protein [Alphaproteobacteria bacterium]
MESPVPNLEELASGKGYTLPQYYLYLATKMECVAFMRGVVRTPLSSSFNALASNVNVSHSCGERYEEGDRASQLVTPLIRHMTEFEMMNSFLMSLFEVPARALSNPDRLRLAQTFTQGNGNAILAAVNDLQTCFEAEDDLWVSLQQDDLALVLG